MRIRLTLAGAALAAVTVVAGAPVAGATDDPGVPPKTNGQAGKTNGQAGKTNGQAGTKKDPEATGTKKDTAAADTNTNTPDLGMAAIPAGNRELVGRIMTGLG
ncbi:MULTISPECIES: hypothetical protein [Streptomyces]|uniref:Uncharacterized protein n=3 Tax=Streptomyces rimosus TaxID=1927 RepID=L8ESK8_STRR1|nr:MULTISPECIES: hypothetical protein [Streptomyces]KOG78236.1 hypothetical protein ADK78_07540 [Kitasatospora aureofaciens]MYT46790.1 hypothetical protein [Streptomyces sp. SID5471]KOT37938.1 hypothetical protein ADK42_18125 [Streptomyces rimosus subsp. rimosus]KOT46048.1 hypothetical protein ADK84_03220 [Streptomyces sp. NRRL WC-3701]KOT60537.1 hypothetical protein ADK44_16680 [Streptomyces rimosus subsp. rimosus]